MGVEAIKTRLKKPVHSCGQWRMHLQHEGVAALARRGTMGD